MDYSQLANPRRVAVGLEQNRLSLLLAVLHKHGGLQMADQDVFVNVVGGVKVTETSADLALVVALLSSFRDRPLPKDVVVFGEVGLAGRFARYQVVRSASTKRSNTVSRKQLCQRLICPKVAFRACKSTG